jgi:PKD domain-containing protein
MRGIGKTGAVLVSIAALMAVPGAADALTAQSVGQGAPALTAQDMADVLAGPGITVEPGAVYTGAPSASGIFGGAGDPYPSSGVALTTGKLGMLSPALPGYARSTDSGAAGDPTASDPLGTGPSVPTFDASVLTFSVVPVSSEFTIDYVFGSNEYGTPVGGGRTDDRVAITVGSAPSCAVVPNTGTIVSVFGIDETHNAGFFRPNTGSPAPFAPIDVSGLTTDMRCTAHVTPGVPVSVKLVVADAVDHFNDSALLLAAGSLRSNRPPVAALAATPSGGKAPRPITFSTAGSTDPDGPATISAWSLVFGDGASTGGSGPPPLTVSHSYARSGAFTATLTLTDDRSDVDSASQAITVLSPNVPPDAGFTISPAAPQTGTDVTLRSTATDPDGTITATTWDLNNDGTFGDASGPTASVRFAKPGTYVLHQRVTDDDGASTEATISLTVTAGGQPVIALLAKSPPLVASASGVTPVKVKCTGASACTGEAQLTVGSAKAHAARASRTTIAIRRYSIAAGKTSKIVFRLTTQGRRLLKKAHNRLKVILTLTPSRRGAKPISTVTTLRGSSKT